MSPTPPVAPDLPIPASPTPWRPLRIVILGIAQALALLLCAAVFDGVAIADFPTALVSVIVLALLGAVLWPVAIRLTRLLITWTVGVFTFVLNGVFVLLVDALVDGFEVASFWSALVVAFVVTVVNLSVGGLLNIDDDNVWRQRVVRRLVRRREDVEQTTEPGFLFIQIDGLGADVLREAMASGHAPTLASLVDHDTHRLLDWECDLSSQTGAMQAGILLGDNTDMPAFRWFEKATGRVMVSNRPSDAADIERRQSTGEGLLRDGGASRANVFSGDADDAMLTFSRVTEGRPAGDHFLYVVATPYTLLRIVALSLVEIVRELREARRARRDGVVPRLDRGGSYPFLRAGTTVALAELTHAMLVADILRGVPAAYVDLVGYDEVAHHSGIRSSDALDTLQRTDDRLRRVLAVLDSAPRPYFVVILSDHGQTQGSTFLQRYGMSLDQLVASLASQAQVEAPVLATEGWNNVNGMLTDVIADDSTLGRTVKRATRGRTADGEVQLGPATEAAALDEDDIVVLASGNLGLVSFVRLDGRATRQQIDAAHPGLIDGLAAHDGVGFVMVVDELEGDIVLGPRGSRRLRDDEVTGDDPLVPFGPRAADHLRRTAGFSNCPDLVVNGWYDPVADEGAAFEELIGFHGGLGGAQTAPFVLAPTQLAAPEGSLIGARSIHDLFTGWLRSVRSR